VKPLPGSPGFGPIRSTYAEQNAMENSPVKYLACLAANWLAAYKSYARVLNLTNTNCDMDGSQTCIWDRGVINS
jgi:hypothetical protein